LNSGAPGIRSDVEKAPWTYEVPEAGTDSVTLEEYVVEEAGGAPVGKVMTILERRGQVYVAVERGNPPLTHDLRAVPWRDVEWIDHSRLTVRLDLPAEAVEETLALERSKAVEGERAEARRVTELPRELRPWSAPEAAGPVDRPSYGVALGSFALGLLALLAILVAALAVDFTWQFVLLAVPAILFLVSLATAYRLFRRPYRT
jgi:hypothetical protein